MKLSTSMIQVFSKVVHGINTREKIAVAIDKSMNRVSEIVRDLEKEGFVVRSKNYTLRGSRIIIEIATTSHATKLKELMFQYPTIKFENILADSKFLFLSALSEDWITIDGASKLSKVSKHTIARYKLALQNRGIISRKKNLYRINEKAWPLLREFLLAYKNYSTIHGYIKWKYQDEILFEVDHENLIQGSITGLAKYKDYSIEIKFIRILCKLPESRLSKEEIFVHSLFQVHDPRTLHLALTFYLKNKLKYEKILTLAMKYGKYTMFENFVKLLKTKADSVKLENLPEFDRKDFARIAKMYGVENVQQHRIG